jgi:hypothetical protein
LRSQAIRLKETNQQAHLALTKKLEEAEKDMPLIEDPELYEGLILEVERVLDECEAQLQAQFERKYNMPALFFSDLHIDSETSYLKIR